MNSAEQHAYIYEREIIVIARLHIIVTARLQVFE